MAALDWGFNPQPKDAPGKFKRERHERATSAATAEKNAKMQAKARDQHKCRWPHTCHKADRLESAHLVDKSLGGSNEPSNLITVCLSVHQGPNSLHSKTRLIEPLDAQLGANGPCAFYEANPETGELVHVATEKAVGVMETRR